MSSSKSYSRSVLVCGGAGYVGSHVVQALLKAGHVPVVLDDLSTGDIRSVPEDVEVVIASIGDRHTLTDLLETHDIAGVIHVCASGSLDESVDNPGKYYANNISNGLVLLKAMLKHGIGDLVFSSSCEVYGRPRRVPVSESSKLNPNSPYGRSHAMFEQILQDAGQAYELRWVTLRYFTAAGALEGGHLGENGPSQMGLIPLALRLALAAQEAEDSAVWPGTLRVYGVDHPTRDGTCVHDYLHVSDVASAHVLALEHLWDGGDSLVANLGNKRGYSVFEVLDACKRVTGVEVPYEVAPRRPADAPQLTARASKARRVLRWRPQHSDLDTIIRTAWDWHRRFGNGGDRAGSQEARSTKR
ncbi:MAG: UDP-glucose 4-epimerase GalE [Planctomycetota bacterium]